MMVICFVTNAQDFTPPPKPVQPSAPKNRINLYGAYVFDDNVNSSYDSYNYFEGKLKGGLQYGAGVEFMVKQDYGVELLWIAQETTAPLTYQSYSYYGNGSPIRYSTFDINLNYAMLAFGRKVKRPGSKLEGYGGLMLGCLFANATNQDYGTNIDDQKFAWGARIGGNFWTSSRVAIKIQAQLLSAVQGAGGSFYFGTGGAGAGVSMYSSMYQFSIGGGLAFAVGK
jgi:hypothetical protein